MSKENALPMPITTHNELPHIKFSIGKGHNTTPIALNLLYDTDTALKTGLDLYHRKLMISHPHMVARFEIFDEDNPFDFIKLCGAITSSDDYDAGKHGILSTVI